MRRCLLRRQDERLFPTFRVFVHLCRQFSLNKRFLQVLTTIYLQRRYHSNVRNFSDVPGKPTVVLESFAQGTLVSLELGEADVQQVDG